MSKRSNEDDVTETKMKKRRSRWQDNEEDKAVLNGLPTTVPSGLTKDQEEQYLKQLKIEEITRRLRTGELGIPSRVEDRSPSPEPSYGPDGKRTNTREVRVKKRLEEDRHKLILDVTKTNPDYKAPYDYKPSAIKLSDKVVIPQEEYPKINFVGLIIGPRGNTLKALEKETGAVIIIRGKGSVKEGKLGMRNGVPLPGQDEPLHAYITSSDPDNLKKAVERIRKVVKEGIENPDGDSDLRKQQLRELALLNGTLREGDPLLKLKQLQESQNIITNKILCTMCGGAGHIALDCKQQRPSESLKVLMNQTALQSDSTTTNNSPSTTSNNTTSAVASTPAISGGDGQVAVVVDKKKMDQEYMSLMAELGVPVSAAPEKPSPPSFTPRPHTPFRPPHNFMAPMQPWMRPSPNMMSNNLPPWQQQPWHPEPNNHFAWLQTPPHQNWMPSAPTYNLVPPPPPPPPQ